VIGPALEGDLGHFSPPEVLQLLQLAQATGRLDFERANERAELFVERGRLSFARTDARAVRTGELLVHRGHATREAVASALRTQVGRGRPIGALLIEDHAATREHVSQAVHEAMRRVVYGLLLWREGRFRFMPGERRALADLEIDLDLDRLILEGLKQADQSRAGDRS
jgi:hypothetical protein